MKTNLLGKLEQQIMEVLWRSNRPLKPAEVLANLKGEHAYTTIMTVLKRMSDKKIVSRKQEGKVYFYCPILNKDQFIESNLSDIYGKLVDSYGKIAISNFVEVIKNNKEDMDALKEYLANHK